METEVISPRVSAPYLDAFKLKTVRIVGRITSLQGEMATLDAGGNVNIHLNRTQDSHLQMGNTAEIVGKVQGDLSVMVYQCMDWGKDIDMNAVDAVVDATHRYKEIFYEGGEA